MSNESQLLAFFSIPKPMVGETAVAQINAVRSWQVSTPASRTYLFGAGTGIAELCQEICADHVPDIRESAYGTPFVSEAFEWMQRNTNARYLCYVNADIIFLNDLARIAERVDRARFLLAGRRWDIEIGEEVDFSDEAWTERLWTRTKASGRLHDEGAIDYFVFATTIDWQMPPLIVGRPGWDNYLLYRARQLRVPVIEATTQVRALHQNHSYSHVPQSRGPKWEGPEGDSNLDAVKGTGTFGLWAATHKMDITGPRRPWSVRYLLRQAYAMPFRYPFILALSRPLYRLAKVIGLKPNRWVADRSDPET